MQGRIVPRWSPSRFPERLQESRLALVAVGRGRPRLDPGMVAWFELTYPGQVSFGTLDSSRLPRGFTEQFFRTARGVQRQDGPEPGVYLFEYGAVVGFHTGVVSSNPVMDELDRFVRPKVSTGRPDTIVAVTRYLSEIAHRKLHGATEWRTATPPPSDRREPPPREERRAPPPTPSAPAASSDHELLGISADATLAEVTRAWREQLKMNHPDKVAHLSPALQQFAQQQTVALTQAYERIKARLR